MGHQAVAHVTKILHTNEAIFAETESDVRQAATPTVSECRGAVYGFARSGRDFIMSFAGWLIMNRWLSVPEAPALHVLWHDGDDAGAIKRAINTLCPRSELDETCL